MKMTNAKGAQPRRFDMSSIVAIITICLLTGCTSDANGAEDESGRPLPASSTATVQPSPAPTVAEFVDHEAFTAEYRDAATVLTQTLPTGAAIPEQPPGEWQQDGQFEKGAGEMQAAFAWQCAWIDAYSDARRSGDQSEVELALQKLEAWIDLPQVSPHIDQRSREVWLKEFVDPARRGDDTRLIDIAASC